MNESARPKLKADYAMSLRHSQEQAVETDVHDLDDCWGWTGWVRRLWPAKEKIIKPGLEFYKFNLKTRELCALLKVEKGGDFRFDSMKEFVRKVERIIGKTPDPDSNDDSFSKWQQIEARLEKSKSGICTGICLTWTVLEPASIRLEWDFPQIGWCDLRKPNCGMEEPK